MLKAAPAPYPDRSGRMGWLYEAEGRVCAVLDLPGPQKRGTGGTPTLKKREIGATRQTSRKLKARGASQFWQRRYYDFNVWSEEKRIEKLRYMHRNPVKRGLVVKPEDWPWSSFRHYATGAKGTVEIESNWTAFQRGNRFPEDLRYSETGGQDSCSPTLRWKQAKDRAPSIVEVSGEKKDAPPAPANPLSANRGFSLSHFQLFLAGGHDLTADDLN